MNKVVLIGRLVKDVDLRYTPNGVAVGNFTLAVQRKFKNNNGDYESDFIRCNVWRVTAENLANYQKKGDLIAVHGAIETGSYEDKDTGKTVYTTHVRAEEVSFLSPKKDGQQGGGQGVPNPYQNNQNSGQQQQPQNQGQGAYNQQQQQGAYNQQQAQKSLSPYDFQQNQGGQQGQQNDPFQNNGEQINISDEDLPF